MEIAIAIIGVVFTAIGVLMAYLTLKRTPEPDSNKGTETPASPERTVGHHKEVKMAKKGSEKSTIQTCPNFHNARSMIMRLGPPNARYKSLTNYAIQQLEHGWMLHIPFGDEAIHVLFESPNKTWKSFLGEC